MYYYISFIFQCPKYKLKSINNILNARLESDYCFVSKIKTKLTERFRIFVQNR